MKSNTVSENEVVEVEETTEELPEKTETIVDDTQDVLDDTENNSQTEEIPLDDVPTNETESVSNSDALEEIAVTFNGESYPEVSGNDVYIIETTTEEPPFWQKPLEEYNTTEGLLLCVFVVICISTLWTNIIGR